MVFDKVSEPLLVLCLRSLTFRFDLFYQRLSHGELEQFFFVVLNLFLQDLLLIIVQVHFVEDVAREGVFSGPERFSTVHWRC